MHQLRRERLKTEHQYASANAWAAVFNAAAYASTMAFVVHLLMQGQILLATCIALFYTVETFQSTYNGILWNIVVAGDDLTYLNDFFIFMDLPENAQEGSGKLNGALGKIELRNVSFTYPGSNKPALTNISLVLHPGERIALVGENGAGKSTLMKLLMGLYQPTAGEIYVEGRSLNDIDRTDWYRRISTVFQDFTRFEASVRDNISYGWVENSANTEAITTVARRSGVMEFIETLPNGLDTLLGRSFHKGVELSVGQWQKLAIARAYFRPADILILDEPASGLDARAEAAFYEKFTEMADGKTVVLISHRLGSARLADRIVVLKEGKIVEEGSHRQLLAADGEYAGMYRAQAEWYS